MALIVGRSHVFSCTKMFGTTLAIVIPGRVILAMVPTSDQSQSRKFTTMYSFKSTLKAAIALGIGIACVMPASAAPPTGASAKIKFDQVGSNVVATLTGTFDLTLGNGTNGFQRGVTPGDNQIEGPFGLDGLLKKRIGVALLNPTGQLYSYYGWNLQYDNTKSPLVNFGSDTQQFVADSSTGAFSFVVWGDTPKFGVDSTYVSGSQMNATSTWNNKSLSGMGIQDGVYRWTYGNSGEHEVKMVVGNAVPEPGEWAAMGILGAGLTGLVIRKRRRTA
ncbi:MAG: PEP-CTERM sorting domain-containing protein [Armatimonadaceae bacterium]